ncbi:DUF2975 domain-containing protein [Flavobacterium lacus]|uniref:DUF2975 family protein n=1 Tax=Flavobacterium lacus TaxID=1353778 RepID=A0A328WPA6_9FLAO|nr:DUF2975 domain-containing protein [Flavobacterium lacus]RAR48041.1 Protein of unknown function (DUF2975) [Flavobacterium lacus]
MRKLYILKTIVDFIWIMSLLFYPIILFLTFFFIFTNEIIDVPIKITSVSIDLTSPLGKIALVAGNIYFIILLVALFYFRKLMNNFRKRLIFEETNQFLFDKIGSLVVVSSIVYLLTDFIASSSVNKVEINFGYGPFLYLLGLGLFFKVLAEVFKIGKTMKDENELTI